MLNKKGRIGRRGQIGNIITTFPVMILVFLLVVIFLAITAIFFGNKVGYPESFGTVGREDLLLKEVSVKYDGGTRQMTVFDAFLEYSRGNIEREEIENGVKSLASDNTCVILDSGGRVGNAMAYRIFDGKAVSFLSTGSAGNSAGGRYIPSIYIPEKYSPVLNKISINIDGEETEIRSYYGECLK